MRLEDKKQMDTITVSSYVNTDAEDLKKNLVEVYDFINDLMGSLPEEVTVSARKVRSVQCTLEYLLRHCRIENATD